MKIIAMIQARCGSTRLPGKVMLPLGDKTVLEQVVDRVQRSENISETIIITTFERDDLEVVKLCANKGIRVFCGSTDDVLDRFYQAAKLTNPDHVVRITADCPLIDPAVIDAVIQKHLEEKNDYTSNVLKETYPDGQDNEVFTFEALKKSWKEASLASEREHVTLYIRNHPEIFQLSNLASDIDLSDKRWTLDTKEDYEFLKEVYGTLSSTGQFFWMEDILKLIKEKPGLEKINHHIGRNEGHIKSLKEDKKIDREE